MQVFSFVKNWPKDYRWLWVLLASVLTFSIVLTWIYYVQGASAIIDWEKIQEQKTIETTVHAFRLGPFQLSIPAESYVILEYLAGSFIKHNFFATHSFLIVLALCAVVLASIISTLERFWYFAGMSLLIIFIVSLRFDVLRLFGSYSILVPICIACFYVLPSFYFRYLKPVTALVYRILTFLLITVVLTLVIYFFSETPAPFLNLLVTAYTPALILTGLFIIMVAHEIPASFVYIVSQGKSESAVRHFMIISIIYLLNVIITCLHELGVIDWNFIYINIFLLLTISALLGIEGFRLREPQYENIFRFSPVGALLYLCLASIAFITIAQLNGNANDATIKVVRYAIIFSHAGYGIIFVAYFFSNFLVMLAEKHNVYRLLYKPNRMPYFTFRFAGLIATLAFLFYSNWRDFILHATGGFYNYVGDMHLYEGNDAFAQSFYEQSRSRAFQNHRANYALAMLKTSRMNLEGAQTNYRSANVRTPSEFSLVNAANLNFWTSRYFDAIRGFRNAEKISGESPAIQNNLGFSYAKTHAVDSASYFFNESRNHDLTKASAEANFLAMTAAEYIPIQADSVYKTFQSESPSVASNALALATLFGQKIDINRDPLANKELNLYSATFLNNYIAHHAASLDTAFLNKAYVLSADSVNASYREALWASLAHSYYLQGQVSKALKILGELGYVTQSYQGTFNYIMGLWALDQGNPELAAQSFSYAQTAEYKNAKFYKAIAFTEARRIDEAINAWDSVSAGDDVAAKELATQLKKILLLPASQALRLNDAEKYQYCRYRIGLRDSASFKALVNSFQDVNYKGQALLEMAQRNFEADMIIPAIRYLTAISGLQLTDKRLFEDIQHFELILLASRRELRQLAQQINKDMEFGSDRQLEKLLYQALISEVNGDIETAKKNFTVLANANPYFEEGILASADFFRRQDPNSSLPYNILVEALYINEHSIRLLKAYAAEASRKGFDEYAASAVQRLISEQAKL
jgi:hypothetical protein